MKNFGSLLFKSSSFYSKIPILFAKQQFTKKIALSTVAFGYGVWFSTKKIFND
jgi:hypothetical protein